HINALKHSPARSVVEGAFWIKFGCGLLVPSWSPLRWPFQDCAKRSLSQRTETVVPVQPRRSGPRPESEIEESPVRRQTGDGRRQVGALTLAIDIVGALGVPDVKEILGNPRARVPGERHRGPG